MSYDVSVYLDGGGEDPVEVGWQNYTSNVSRIWDDAGAPLRDWDGKNAGEAEPLLRAAARRIRHDIARYREWNAPNGWGDADGAAAFLDRIADDCLAAPKGYLHIRR